MKTPFYLALLLLTQIPVPYLRHITPKASGQSVVYYPLVGLIIGLIISIPSILFHTSPVLLAAISLVFWVLITGGLHLDGLADSADAWLGGMGDTQKTHQIMKDPLIGSSGAIALISLMLLKFSALSVLLEMNHILIIILAPVIGRLSLLLLLLTTPYKSHQGMAHDIVKHLPRKVSLLVLIVSSIIIIPMSVYGVVTALIIFWLLRRIMLKRIQGCTGDTLGATVEITEASWLIGSALTLS